MENDDEIRAPDQMYNDQLLEDNRSEFEKQTDEALYLSMQEMSQQQTQNHQYETRVIDDYNQEVTKRRDEFKGLLFDLQKLVRFDADIKNVYDILDPLLESYANQFFETCELDDATYSQIFRVLNKIRTNKEPIERLKKIIRE